MNDNQMKNPEIDSTKQAESSGSFFNLTSSKSQDQIEKSNSYPTGDMATDPYPLTIKKGILAIIAMYACQILVGIAVSYAFRFMAPTGEVEIEIVGLLSVLLSGVMVLLLLSWDAHRSGASFYPQIGLQPSTIKNSKAVLLVIVTLGTTHFLAWIYRSVILPMFEQGGVIGSGSQMNRFQMQKKKRIWGWIYSNT
jgi:hypothetical protein